MKKTEDVLVSVHSLLKPRPIDGDYSLCVETPSMGMGGGMFIGYAVQPLRDEARLHAASTPIVEAVLATGYSHDFAGFNGA